MTDTMKIWNAVCETDPKVTKIVNQRGGFTAICAQSQIEAATKQFGPIGDGWGFSAEYIPDGNVIMCQLTLWHGNRANEFGPICGAAELMKGERVDTDAPKKACTDALTKALSYLGFNADVFLGKFDDNKYVEKMKQKFTPQEDKEKQEARDLYKRLEAIDHDGANAIADAIKGGISLPEGINMFKAALAKKEAK